MEKRLEHLPKEPTLTTLQGHPITDDQNQRTIGPRGPATLENYQFLEKITHFDRERAPERVVHARGFVAYGEFEATGTVGDEPAAKYTRAKLFQAAGKKTRVSRGGARVDPTPAGTPEAESGQLVVLAGGEQADVDAAKSILDVIGRKTVHTGPVGSGLAVKLVINGVMALGTAALAEGLAYGVKAGADRDTLIDTSQDLILVSEHPRRKLEVAKHPSYSAQFPTKLLLKDLGLLLAETAHHGVPMPSMAAAAQLYSL